MPGEIWDFRCSQGKTGREVSDRKKNIGQLEDPERFKAVRKVKLLNDAMPFIRAIQEHGHVQHYGMGASRFWDKTAFLMSRVRDQAKQAVKKTWQKLFDSRRDKRPDIER